MPYGSSLFPNPPSFSSLNWGPLANLGNTMPQQPSLANLGQLWAGWGGQQQPQQNGWQNYLPQWSQQFQQQGAPGGTQTWNPLPDIGQITKLDSNQPVAPDATTSGGVQQTPNPVTDPNSYKLQLAQQQGAVLPGAPSTASPPFGRPPQPLTGTAVNPNGWSGGGLSAPWQPGNAGGPTARPLGLIYPPGSTGYW